MVSAQPDCPRQVDLALLLPILILQQQLRGAPAFPTPAFPTHAIETIGLGLGLVRVRVRVG